MALATPMPLPRRFARYRFEPELRARLRATHETDNWHALWFFAVDAAWVAACIAACELAGAWLYPAAVVIIGARQRALSTIFHDCVHGVAARSRLLRGALGSVLTAYPIFQRFGAYRASHVLAHHPWLGDPARDPDLRYFLAEGVYARTPRRRSWARLVIRPLLGARTVSFLRYLFRTRFGAAWARRAPRGLPPRLDALDRAGFWVFWAVVVGAAWRAGALAELALFWVVPYLTSFQLLSWFIELSEHTPLFREHDVDLYMTRNRKSRGLERFLTGIHNDNYHWDHHLDPRTPCWRLPEAHAIRMADPAFAALDRAMGGLVTRGPEGQPSAIAAIVDAVSLPEEARRDA